MSPDEGSSVAEILERATRLLVEAAVPEARADALALLAAALGTDRGGVIARKPDVMPADAAARAQALVARRAARIPLQQITGRVLFHGLTIDVDEHVLIPRPETEDLVDAVLEAGLPDGARVADLGTGSGCVAIALAAARPAWSLLAVDVSAAALAVARRNAARHRMDGRLRLVEADFAAPLAAWRGTFDAVVSNPPYVPEDEWRGLQPEVRDHEPKIALVPGPTGNEAYESVVRAARDLLVPGGLMALELGWTSEPAVRALAEAAGFGSIRVRPDLQGIPRVLVARS